MAKERKESINEFVYNTILKYNPLASANVNVDNIDISKSKGNTIVAKINNALLRYTLQFDDNGTIEALIEAVLVDESEILKHGNLKKFPIETPYGNISYNNNREEDNENEEKERKLIKISNTMTLNNEPIKVIHLYEVSKAWELYQPLCFSVNPYQDNDDDYIHNVDYMRVPEYDHNGMIAFIVNRYWFGMNIVAALFDPINKIIYCDGHWNFDWPKGVTLRNNNGKHEVYFVEIGSRIKNAKILYKKNENVIINDEDLKCESFWYPINMSIFFKKIYKHADWACEYISRQTDLNFDLMLDQLSERLVLEKENEEMDDEEKNEEENEEKNDEY